MKEKISMAPWKNDKTEVYDSNGNKVASVLGCFETLPREERQMANLRLITAAPTMFELLKCAVTVLTKTPSLTEELVRQIVEFLNALNVTESDDLQETVNELRAKLEEAESALQKKKQDESNYLERLESGFKKMTPEEREAVKTTLVTLIRKNQLKDYSDPHDYSEEPDCE